MFRNLYVRVAWVMALVLLLLVLTLQKLDFGDFDGSLQVSFVFNTCIIWFIWPYTDLSSLIFGSVRLDQSAYILTFKKLQMNLFCD